ncbi:hypothetical protein ADUPG1_013162 [Aduncisulcus paluster]|uniref:Uncharacterized protein n=1 Tax=Aduncisulcus paluster TaxID=2918883 RepID=A0ABQ5K1Z5_9EUKA|nr:hypothetical protein ADUPG1_013162 [Aduncisulcus paluster]
MFSRIFRKIETVKPIFKGRGDKKHPPIPRTSSNIIVPDISNVICLDKSVLSTSSFHNRSLEAQNMILGDASCWFSHLKIPFLTPIYISGVYICVFKIDGPPYLELKLSSSTGKTRIKRYEFSRPKEYEWYLLPIEIENVTVCRIEGKGMWRGRDNKNTCIHGMIFV